MGTNMVAGIRAWTFAIAAALTVMSFQNCGNFVAMPAGTMDNASLSGEATGPLRKPQATAAMPLENAEHLHASGNLLFTGTSDGQVAILDISDPKAPVSLANVHAQGPMSGLGVIGNFLFVPMLAPAGTIKIFDIRAPAKPTLVSTYQASAPMAGGFFVGTNLFLILYRQVPTGKDGVSTLAYSTEILDMKIPIKPVRLGTVEAALTHVTGPYFMASDGKVYESQANGVPVQKGSILSSGESRPVAASFTFIGSNRSMIPVTDGTSYWLKTFDTKTVAAPSFLASIPFKPSMVAPLFIGETFIYAARAESMRLIDVFDGAAQGTAQPLRTYTLPEESFALAMPLDMAMYVSPEATSFYFLDGRGSRKEQNPTLLSFDKETDYIGVSGQRLLFAPRNRVVTDTQSVNLYTELRFVDLVPQ